MEDVKYSLLGGSVENNLLLPTNIEKHHHEPRSDRIKRNFKRNWRCYGLLFIVIILIVATIVVPIVILRSKKSNELSYKCGDYGKELIDTAQQGTQAYNRLVTLCTLYPSRVSGSSTLEDAIDWIEQELTSDGFSNVHTEPVNVTHWVRGNEYATIQSPYYKKLNILGLVGSIGTNYSNPNNTNGITGEVLVVSSFQDLQNKSSLVPGKIVLFNAPFVDYGTTVVYRTRGATTASQYGAIACLVRSITPFSLGTPHTGGTYYNTSNPLIPTAAVTVEDATLMQNLQNMNQTIVVNLYMEAQTMPQPALSRNVMGDIVGSDLPDEVVVVGGHIDALAGQGAMDDGGGVLVSWEALRIIKNSGIVPRRTIRFVAWTNEENGAAGAMAYASLHANETFFSIESDGGATNPYGFSIDGASSSTISSLQKIADEVLGDIGSNQITVGEAGTDNSFLVRPNIAPGANLVTNMTQYFWYHHSEGDGIDKMNPKQMDDCVATLAAMLICLANYNGPLPI